MGAQDRQRACPTGPAASHRARGACSVADDLLEALPVAGRLADTAVNDQVVGSLGDLRIEIVHDHPQGRLGQPGLRAARGSSRGTNGPGPVIGRSSIQHG